MKIRFHLSVVFTIISLTTFGQQSKWEELKMDSADFAYQYGTEFQYNYQKRLQKKSRSKMACIFVGSQFMWWYELAAYLNSKNYTVEADANDQQFIITALSNSKKDSPDSSVKAIAFLNQYSQITKAIITGPKDDINAIFFDFWDTELFTLSEMATKRQATKFLEGDKIALKFLGANLMIAITPNTNFNSNKFELKN